MTAKSNQLMWTVEAFERFWANPDPSLVASVLTTDVRGYWPWNNTPVQGVGAYVDAIAKIIEYVPGLRLTVSHHATNGNCTFVQWIMHGNGVSGRFELAGIDRMILRDGLVAENLIRFDSGQLYEKIGAAPYWK